MGWKRYGRWNSWQRGLELSAGFEEGEGHAQGVPLRGFGGSLGTHEGCPCGKCGAVCVGPGWALRCLRWMTLGTRHDGGWGGSPGRSGSSRSYNHTLAAAGGLGGALRGRSPRTREGRIGPTAQNCSGQWLVVSGQLLEPALSIPRRQSRTGRRFVAERGMRAIIIFALECA